MKIAKTMRYQVGTFTCRQKPDRTRVLLGELAIVVKHMKLVSTSCEGAGVDLTPNSIWIVIVDWIGFVVESLRKTEE